MSDDEKAPERITAFPEMRFGGFGEEVNIAPWCKQGKEIWRGGTEYIRADLAEPPTCGTCQEFRTVKGVGPFGYSGVCDKLEINVPEDGSGFCHEHEPKEADDG